MNIQENFCIYPNPASKSIAVTLPYQTSNENELVISNSLGAIFQKYKVLKGVNNICINTESFPNGVYFLSINENDIFRRQNKIIIQH